MAKYIFKSVLMVIPTMLLVVFIIFTINYFTPGDPVAVFFDFDYTEEQYAEKAAEWGLDQPFFTQFVRYIKNIVTRFDFGYSYYSGNSVMSELTTRFPVSLRLGLISVLLTVVIGVPFGIISATRQHSLLDYGVTFVSLFFAAVPGFWLSMILILIFSSRLGWFPSSGLDGWTSYVMPVIASSAQYVASVTRQTRSSMLEVIRQDYIRTARAKGLSEGRVVYHHAFRNTLIPLVTIIGGSLPGLFSGALITETLFSIPGIGYTSYQAMVGGDIPFTMFYLTFIAILTLAGNLISDILYAVVDPRVRLS